MPPSPIMSMILLVIALGVTRSAPRPPDPSTTLVHTSEQHLLAMAVDQAQCVLEAAPGRCLLWFDVSPEDGQVQRGERGEIRFEPRTATLWFTPPCPEDDDQRRPLLIADGLESVTFQFDDVDARFSRRLIAALSYRDRHGVGDRIGVWLSAYRFPQPGNDQSLEGRSIRNPDAGSPMALMRSASTGSGDHAYLTH